MIVIAGCTNYTCVLFFFFFLKEAIQVLKQNEREK